jgi:signal transduction histidine kinase
MLALFQQSATAQAGQAEAEIGRACDAITSAYRFYTTGVAGSGVAAESLRRGLGEVLQTALLNRYGIEGGIWQEAVGSLAYAFPTYQGSGRKTDLPLAEAARIGAVNQRALAQDGQFASRYAASSQILLVTACPLPGPIPHLTAWTMTRVSTFAGRSYRQLMTGLGILFLAVLAAAVLLTQLTASWSRHVGGIEKSLATYDMAALPTLPLTGERELDRIVTALNGLGQRLADARKRETQLAREIAIGQRLAAIGRVTAGLAHEIRNPIAAMKLKAEGAIGADAQRKDQALSAILGQVERLDELVRRLLSVTHHPEPKRTLVRLDLFLEACLAPHRELAHAQHVRLVMESAVDCARFDGEQLQRALDNLILNAIHAAPEGSRITVVARRDHADLVLSVHDAGAGPPAEIREQLFEPFVTGRPDGTGLGLSIVREIAAAHDGTARLGHDDTGTVVEIVLPWQPS